MSGVSSKRVLASRLNFSRCLPGYAEPMQNRVTNVASRRSEGTVSTETSGIVCGTENWQLSQTRSRKQLAKLAPQLASSHQCALANSQCIHSACERKPHTSEDNNSPALSISPWHDFPSASDAGLQKLRVESQHLSRTAAQARAEFRHC